MIYVLQSNNSLPRYSPTRNDSICPPEAMYKDIQGSFLHKGPNLQTPQMPINDSKMDNTLQCTHTVEYHTAMKKMDHGYTATWRIGQHDAE